MSEPRPSIMQSLGLFFGHIVKAAKHDVTQKPHPQPAGAGTEVRREVQEEVRQGPNGPMILRRTVIEEVEMPGPPAIAQPTNQVDTNPPRA